MAQLRDSSRACTLWLPGGDTDAAETISDLLRGHFPNEQAALKVLYLVATQRRPNRENLTGKTNGWKSILNALTVHYGDRITATN